MTGRILLTKTGTGGSRVNVAPPSHETIAFSNLRFLSVLFGYCRYLLTRASEDTLDNGHDVFHLPFEHTCFSVVSSDKRFETLVCFLKVFV
jgi:hypothetical protein